MTGRPFFGVLLALTFFVAGPAFAITSPCKDGLVAPKEFAEPEIKKPTWQDYRNAVLRWVIWDFQTLPVIKQRSRDADAYQARKQAFEKEQTRIVDHRTDLHTTIDGLEKKSELRPAQAAAAQIAFETARKALSATYDTTAMDAAATQLKATLSLLALRDRAHRKVDQFSNVRLLPSQDASAQRFVEEARQAVEALHEERDLDAATAKLDQQITELLSIKTQIEQIREETRRKFDDFLRRCPTNKLCAAYKLIVEGARHEMDQSLSASQLKSVSDRAIGEIQQSLGAYYAEQKARQERELRFDPSEESQTEPILTHYLQFASALSDEHKKLVDKILLKKAKLVEYLAHHNQRDARTHLAREVRYLVRLKRASPMPESVSLRASTTLLALAEQAENGQGFQRLLSARESLASLMLNHRFFSNGKKGVLRELSRHEQELIVAEAQKSPELLATLMGSDLRDRPAQRKPIEPKKPNLTPVNKPSEFSSRPRNKAEARRLKEVARKYKADVAAWKKPIDQYKTDSKKYAEALKAHVKHTRKAATLRKNRKAYESSLLAYFAYRHPNTFVNQRSATVLKTDLEKFRVTRAQKLSGMGITTPQSAMAATTSTSGTSSSSFLNSGFNDWCLFFLTNDPWWLISPKIALVRLMVDIFFAHPMSATQKMGEMFEEVVANEAVLQMQYDRFASSNADKIQSIDQLGSAFSETTRAEGSANATSTSMEEAKLDADAPEVRSLDDTQAAERQAEQALESAGDVSQQADRSLEEAERVQAQAEAQIDQADHLVAEAQRTIEQAEKAVAEAEQAVTQAEQAVAAAEQTVRDAESVASSAEATASAVESASSSSSLGGFNSDE